MKGPVHFNKTLVMFHLKTVCSLLSDNLDFVHDGILTLKLGGFRNSKPNFKEYSRKNEIKVMKNQPKV